MPGSPILDQDTRDTVAEEFKVLARPVKLVVFTQKEECRFCEEARLLAGEVVSLSPLLSLEVRDFVADREEAARLGVDKIPALAVIGPTDDGIRFFGFPGGYEFTSLIEAVKTAGADRPPVSEESINALNKLTVPVGIQVFVTPTWPYCPQAVVTAQRLAKASPLLSAAMIDVVEFPHLVQRYAVRAIPKVVLNETHEFVGALPEPQFVEMILRAGEAKV